MRPDALSRPKCCRENHNSPKATHNCTVFKVSKYRNHKLLKKFAKILVVQILLLFHLFIFLLPYMKIGNMLIKLLLIIPWLFGIKICLILSFFHKKLSRKQFWHFAHKVANRAFKSIGKNYGQYNLCSSNSSECVSLILPCMIELCKDEDPGVREAILNTVAVCLPYFTKGIQII